MEANTNQEGTMFKLTIETDNDAFADGQAGEEIARLLRLAADKMEDDYREGQLVDYNGNRVGWYGLES